MPNSDYTDSFHDKNGGQIIKNYRRVTLGSHNSTQDLNKFLKRNNDDDIQQEEPDGSEYRTNITFGSYQYQITCPKASCVQNQTRTQDYRQAVVDWNIKSFNKVDTVTNGMKKIEKSI